uniref:Uncharacterized protein n=1 Tax=Anser cygnoides TaxID=8845 RepID=A0A8B9EM91_ANSCY
MKKFHKQTNNNNEQSAERVKSGTRPRPHDHLHQKRTQILTDIKGSFQSLDIGCNPRDTVDAHLLHPTSLYLLHTLAHDTNAVPEGGNTTLPKLFDGTNRFLLANNS